MPGEGIPPELAARLADPRVTSSLLALLDRLDVLVLVAASLDGLLAHSETILDSAAASAADARATFDAAAAESAVGGLDGKATMAAAASLVAALPEMAPALLRGVSSGAIEALTSEGLVDVLRVVAEGAAGAGADPSPVEIRGAMSLARALKDPDVARALSFFLTLTRAIGRRLASGTRASAHA